MLSAINGDLFSRTQLCILRNSGAVPFKSFSPRDFCPQFATFLIYFTLGAAVDRNSCPVLNGNACRKYFLPLRVTVPYLLRPISDTLVQVPRREKAGAKAVDARGTGRVYIALN